jgi:hypothetical protein
MRALNNELAASDLHGNKGIAPPPPTLPCVYEIAWTSTYQILLNLALLSPPTSEAAGNKQSMIDHLTLYIHTFINYSSCTNLKIICHVLDCITRVQTSTLYPSKA